MFKKNIRIISVAVLLSSLSGTMVQTMDEDELIVNEEHETLHSYQLFLALQDRKIEEAHSDCMNNCMTLYHAEQEPLLAKIKKEFPNIHLMPADKRDAYSRIMANISAEHEKCKRDCGQTAISQYKQKGKPGERN